MEGPLGARAALLQALVLPGYGFELIDRVRRATRARVRIGTGSLYPALQRLLRDGLVRHLAIDTQEHAGRPRRYFELTVLGVHARNSDRRALSVLFRMEPARSGGATSMVEERLRRCARLSASVLDLRDRVRPRRTVR